LSRNVMLCTCISVSSYIHCFFVSWQNLQKTKPGICMVYTMHMSGIYHTYTIHIPYIYHVKPLKYLSGFQMCIIGIIVDIMT
jgi:hypothetical protein